MNILKYLFNGKYQYFFRKMRGVQNALWDIEFKIAKSRQIRESVRQDRDRMVEVLNNTVKSFEAETDQAKKEVLEKQKTYQEDTVKRYEAQMQMIDNEIVGVRPSAPTAEFPEGNPGQQGLADTVASLAELREMYKQFLITL